MLEVDLRCLQKAHAVNSPNTALHYTSYSYLFLQICFVLWWAVLV